MSVVSLSPSYSLVLLNLLISSRSSVAKWRSSLPGRTSHRGAVPYWQKSRAHPAACTWVGACSHGALSGKLRQLRQVKSLERPWLSARWAPLLLVGVFTPLRFSWFGKSPCAPSWSTLLQVVLAPELLLRGDFIEKCRLEGDAGIYLGLS